MTLEEFDKWMVIVDEQRRFARSSMRSADNLEALILKQAGVYHIGREPDSPCWTAKDAVGFFNTPREVLEARQKKGEAS